MDSIAEDKLISVIVPIYKVEKYLDQCVQSLIHQSYQKLEIILVDDGSPDRCPMMCDQYAQEDPRIKVIHKPNGGLSDARNAGLRICQGEYIVFVDSDDWMPQDAMEYLLRLLQNTRADIAVGGHARVYDGQDIAAVPQADTISELSAQEAMKDFFVNGCASWARIYRRGVHIDLEFPVGEINEDEAIVLPLLDRCVKIAVSSHIVYYYRCRDESITTAAFNRRKLQWVKHCHANLEYTAEHHPELVPYAEKRYFGSLSWALYQMAGQQAFCEICDWLRHEMKSRKQAIRNSELFSQREKTVLMVQTYGWPAYRLYKKLRGAK